MSKHRRHRDNEHDNRDRNRNMNMNTNNNPLNMNNLSELLKNTDMNQLSAMLASLSNNQANTQDEQEPPVNQSPNDNMGRMSNMGNMGNMSGNRDLMLLSALKPFLTPQKAELLDRFIELYAQSENRNSQGNR